MELSNTMLQTFVKNTIIAVLAFGGLLWITAENGSSQPQSEDEKLRLENCIKEYEIAFNDMAGFGLEAKQAVGNVTYRDSYTDIYDALESAQNSLGKINFIPPYCH